MVKTDSIRSIALDHITRDPTLQMRITINVDHVEELAQVLRDGGELPPPTVFSDGRTNWLADGNHTYEAHIAAGVRKIRCLVKAGQYRDAWMYALGANSSHGLKRTQADKRKAIIAALRDDEVAALSDNEVAKICGLAWHSLVSDIRRELAAGLEKVEFRPSKGGWLDSAGNPVASGKDNKEDEPEGDGDDDLPQEFGDQVGSADSEIAAALNNRQASGPADSMGRPVPDGLLSVFEDRKRIGGIRNEFGRLSTAIKHLKNGDGAELMPSDAAKWIDANHVAKLIDDIQRTLRFGSPYIVCPRCGGSRKRSGESCDVCHGAGFLPEMAYSRLDSDLRSIAEQWKKGEAWEGDEQTNLGVVS